MSSSRTQSQAACRKVSEVWDHFTKEGSNVVRCNICQRTFNHHRTTGTYWHHLMYRHESAYKASNYYKAGLANGQGRRLSAQTPRKEQKETPTRFSFTERQRKLLELSFAQNNYISLEKRARLAKKFGVGETSIKNWFMARRHQEKRRSLQDGPTAIEHVAKEAEAHQDARDGNANAAPMDQADSEPQAVPDANDVAAVPAATPDADSDDEPSPALERAQLGLLRNLQRQMMPPAVYRPQQVALQQPLPAPMQQAPALADDLVETRAGHFFFADRDRDPRPET
ncbi:oocyte specific homeobox 6 [Aphelenchoides avenae]|nr:oocyte specific homeobox 6 [Aphelenchus avenae]